MNAVRSELEVRTLKAEPVSREAFQPFGDMLSPEGLDRLPIDLYGDRLDCYRTALFESDRPVEFMLTRLRLRGFRVDYLERHHLLTQTLVPIGGGPMILVVARPNAREEDGVPAIEELRAFILPGDVGVNMHRGTWHETPFPLDQPVYLLATMHRDIVNGLTAASIGDVSSDEYDVDKRDVTQLGGYVLKIELP